MSNGGRPGGGVSEGHRNSDFTRKHRVAQAPGFTRRTAINPSGSLNGLTDGTVCSVAATTRDGNQLYKALGDGWSPDGSQARIP